jgi:suppressor for copper-sensitivity B
MGAIARSIVGAAALVLLVCGLVLPGAPGGALAAASSWAVSEQSEVRLLAASDSVGDAATLTAGLHFKLQPGWKIYWRSPGDAGYPPQVDWSGSENLASVETEWPLPHRFELFGLQTFGYGEEVVLPLKVSLAEPGKPARLEASVDYLTCSEICVPQTAELSLDLPAGPGGEAFENILIKRFERQVPGTEAEGLSLTALGLSGSLEKPVIQALLKSGSPLQNPDLLVEGPPGFLFGKPQVDLRNGGREALIEVAVAKGPLAEGVIDGKPLTLTLMDGGRGLERKWVARYAAPAEALGLAGGSGLGLLAVLGLALLGGLILNVMPCVLPVLSIKLLSVAKQGGREARLVRFGFLASVAGIVASFWLLALLAILLKEAGLAVGWGIQFQQPVFLAFMAFLLTLFACNLFGFFEIPLPSWLGTAAARSRPDHGLAGHFLTGALATLLATPCSAPFLGTAVGFALARGPFEILLIFTALGLGLAVPYLMIAAFPRLATRLPKPGHWMITLRRLLGLALAGTAAWLLSVMAAQISLWGALAVGGLLLAIALVIWLSGRGGALARVALPGVAMLALLVVLASALLPAPEDSAQYGGKDALWSDFKQADLESLVAGGKVVFVDVTADWCITCQVNKSLVLYEEPVLGALKNEGVIALQADWTNPDPEIAAYLNSFGRYGIPFNAVYGPGAPQGLALPELLSESAVLEALKKARGG